MAKKSPRVQPTDITFARKAKGKNCYCPHCLTEYARKTKELGKTEKCGVCLDDVVLVEGPVPAGAKKQSGRARKAI
jgi:hypothetical protein